MEQQVELMLFKCKCRVPDLPCFIRQVKYWTPATEPSFFPSGLSSSTPAHRPPENSVLPQNRRVPTCARRRATRKSTYNADKQPENCPVQQQSVKSITHVMQVKDSTASQEPNAIWCLHVYQGCTEKQLKRKTEIKALNCVRECREHNKSLD